jgi:uncharacterized protein YjbI with pentapeptide repeats
MANDEQVEMLKKGAAAWNTWRQENPDIRDIRPDLSGADLSGADLSGADLSGADLSRADLGRADLSEAILGKAILTMADLREADLRLAYLGEANLREANLSEANLSGAKLVKTNLYRATFLYANLYRATFLYANLSGADLSGADLPMPMLRSTLSTSTHRGGSDVGIYGMRYRWIHSPLIPEALMIGHHLLISASCSAKRASGVCCSRGQISWPASVKR